jgi:signal transduction histidine kinase
VKVTDNPSRATLSTTVFGLSALAVAAFLVVTAVLFALAIWHTNRVFVGDVLDALNAEAEALLATSQQGDADTLQRAVARLSSKANSRLYYLASPSGTKLAGNLADLPPELANRTAGGLFTYRYDRGPQPGERTAAGLPVRLRSGGLLVVARDIEDQRSLIWWMRFLALVAFSIIALGGLGLGYMASRSVLTRVDRLTYATRNIMAGDLSGRLPFQGNGDEFDRLSQSVNDMLSRIEHLMHGLKEVSDNIAHDLKTPLNRLRHRAEATLRTAKSKEDLTAGLGQTIEAADEIIKTFNALLLIARLEAGAIEKTKTPVCLASVLSDAAELYEPVAEEAGLHLSTTEMAALTVNANRQLIGQAVINLLDNAIKYGRKTAPGCDSPSSADSVLGEITISLNRRHGNAEIAIADNGPGISASDRTRAMERFVRLDKSRSLPGTGLGLSLVAAVARLHGGELRLEDNAPGLKAVLSLPL